MKILTVRTDKPEAEVGLYEDDARINYVIWEAHRGLTITIHKRIQEILDKSSINWNDINAIVCFEGPGSFTGLRIGLSVANALAYAESIPVVTTAGKEWISDGISRLLQGEDNKVALPAYGRSVNITQPKK